MKRHFVILFACLFVVMVGFGLTLPVLVFYIERLALADGATSQQASVHVGMLTGTFAVMQFFFAPLWGRLSDRVGRRPLILIGLGGYVVSMVLFGVGTRLVTLYLARILGGALSAAVLPAASAYVADVTPEKQRGRGMAWLGSAISLGVVVGPGLGALLSRLDWPSTGRFGHFTIDSFSMPFFAAALLAFLALLAASSCLPESMPAKSTRVSQDRNLPRRMTEPKPRWWFLRGSLGQLLGLSLLSQFALALFEGTFALHAQWVLTFGPTQMGVVFMTCGLVMAAMQIGPIGWLIDHVGEKTLLSAGFALAGVGLALLMTAQSLTFILVYVALFALAMAMLSPSLAALVTKHAGNASGTALGLQSAANSLGQAGGPFVGSILFAWHIHLPYLLTALLLIGVAILVGRVTWQ